MPAQRRSPGVDAGRMPDTFRSMTTARLRAEGLTRAGIARAVSSGTVIRARRGIYVSPLAPDAILRACRVGGRLTCTSLLALLKVFVLEPGGLHVHMASNASRMRSPHSRAVALEPRGRRNARLHWLPLADAIPDDWTCVSIVDALAHSVHCQTPRAAVATLDSAVNLGLITADRMADVFRLLPEKYAPLRALVDGRAESGPETLVRLMLRALGCRVDLQVEFAGIGRVDLLVNGWLVVECDSREFHDSWEQQVKDRNRDLALAARGYVTLRLTAAQIMYRPADVLAALKGLLATR